MQEGLELFCGFNPNNAINHRVHRGNILIIKEKSTAFVIFSMRSFMQ